MGKQKNFIMKWPELNVSIECGPRKGDINRWIYDWYVGHMPLRYLQSHAMLTGRVVYALNVRLPDTLPELADHTLVKVRHPEAKAGNGHFSYNIRNGLAGGRVGHIGLVYGPTYEDMDAYFCFDVLEKDMDKLMDVGPRIWQAVYKTKQIISCELSVVER